MALSSQAILLATRTRTPGLGEWIAVAVWFATFAGMTGLCVWSLKDKEDEPTPTWRQWLGRIGVCGVGVANLGIIGYTVSIGWLVRFPLAATIIIQVGCSLALAGIGFGMFGQGKRRLMAFACGLAGLVGWTFTLIISWVH